MNSLPELNPARPRILMTNLFLGLVRAANCPPGQVRGSLHGASLKNVSLRKVTTTEASPGEGMCEYPIGRRCQRPQNWRRVPGLSGSGKMEARVGIEPAYTELQSAA